MMRIGHFVGGKAVAGGSGRTAPVYDPALGVQTAEVTLASAAEVDAVVQVAVDAARSMGRLVPDDASRLDVPTA